MSGKKSKTPLGWLSCPKCQRRLPRNLFGKHTDAECSHLVLPFIQSEELYSSLQNATTASRIQNLPFVKSFRLSSSTLFLPEEMIRESGFKTFSWVLVSTYQESKDIDQHMTPIAVRIWPIPDSIGSNSTSNLHVMMTKDGYLANHFQSQDQITLKVEKLSCNLTVALNSVIVEVDDLYSPIDSVTFNPVRFISSLKTSYRGRLIREGNHFRLRYYAEVISFRVANIQLSETFDQLEEAFRGLSISNAPIHNEKNVYGEVVDNTEVELRFRSKLKLIPQDHLQTVNVCDIGGLDDILKELQATINFLLVSDLNVARGILLFGHSGTGKSLVIKALCKNHNLTQINFNEFHKTTSSTSLSKVFLDAQSKSPSAIVIENIDTLAPNKTSSTNPNVGDASNFSSNFQLLLSNLELRSKKVIILATATDVDAIDQRLRSPQIFGKEVELSVPSRRQREQILNSILSKMQHSLNMKDILEIAASTHGFVGADLHGLCTQAVQNAVERWNGDNSKAVIEIQDLVTCLKSVKPSAAKSILVDVPNVRWDDIGGQSELKFKLKQAIEWPLKHPEAFKRLGITPPKGILMYGPPGCSKTMIAKAIATESGLNFISVKGSELFSKWVGESEKAVRDIFRKARQVAPCVVFFDEIDSLGGERGSTSGSSNVHERVLAQLLVELDGIEPLKDVTIVAATNRPDIIDQALLRPGRLDRIIYVPLPDAETRREILRIRFQKMPVSLNIDLEKIVALTEYYSGAELTGLSQEAAMKALEEDITSNVVEERHFTQALEILKPRISKEQIQFYETYKSSRQNN